jgi:hypothetical protein
MMYIEDYLHILVDSYNTLPSDKGILSSISKQCKKGTGLTDRQYNLLLSKIPLYKDQFEYYNEDDLKNTRCEIRTIDRSKYITVVDNTDLNIPVASHKSNWNWIKVRFPFSKKDIVKLESLAIRKDEYLHDKGSHEHYFLLNASNAYKIVTAFQNKNFNIDNDLIDLSNKTLEIVNQKEKYVPFTEHGILYNVPEFVHSYIDAVVIEESDRELFYADRSLLFDYAVPQTDPVNLTEQIAFRQEKEVTLSPENHSMEDIVKSLVQLNRFPIVVLIDTDQEFTQVTEISTELSKYVSNKEQSVLFRVDNSHDTYNLNNYVHDNQLNNWVDNTTKVVYIKKNKLPKLLLNSEFKPITALAKTSLRSNPHINLYVGFNCDLVVNNDKLVNMFNKWSRIGQL